ESGDRVLRENAFKAYYGVFGANRNALASMLDAQVRRDIFFARARKYETSLASALFPSEVPEAVYHNLLLAVHQNMDKMHKYMDLRKKVMGLDELHMYDIYASMLPEADQVIPFQQAKEEVLEATKVLGEEYHQVLAASFEQRWMDIYENEGKRSGAYSCGCQVHPFVLLNHKDTLNSEFTLAHEMGHAMHSYLSNKYQSPIYAGYELFVAEVASTCNEALLMQYLLGRTTDKKQRAVLINYFLEQFRTTLYRQTMFAEFELDIHRMV
ncbi:MAG: oligoendopeptidase F, partial [Oscillospiraceae bacterium]|nr:oligoendopeptidase F [Oscillospiraceae bacterium]